MMKENLLKEMELIRTKIKENKFVCLKEYPNRGLSAKSKIINFKNNNESFDERCMLFIEFTYLLLKIQVDLSVVYVTKNMFVNNYGQIFYLYTFDSRHEHKMVKFSHGNLLQNILMTFNHIFIKEAQQIKDYQYQTIHQKAVNPLISYLEQLKQKSDQYYYQSQGQTKYNYQFEHQPSKPYPILLHLQNSILFKEYNFPIKYNTAIVIRGIIDNKTKNEIKTNYIILSHEYEILTRDLDHLNNALSINRSIGPFYLNLFYFLKMLQKSLYIKVTVSQNDFSSTFQAVRQDQVTCDISFQSNIKNEVRINETSQEQSSQSSINDKEMTTQQRDKYNRNKEYMESLFIFKNKINFNVKIRYKIPIKIFQIQIEALSLWAIEEIYFVHFRDFWGRLVNDWYNSSNNSQDIDYKVEDLKCDIFHKSKNIGLKTIIKIGKRQNLIEELIVIYDKIVIILLLLEHTFKKIYKLGYFIYQFNKRPLQQMIQPAFLQNKITKLKYAFVKYTQYYRELVKLTKK